VAQAGQFDEKALGQAVEGVADEEDAHGKFSGK
jgi:hypothetical protein